MSAYGAVMSARFRLLLQYRAAAVAGFATQLVWGLIRVMVFEAFYRSTGTPQPMTLEQVVTYVWLGQALFAMLPWNLDPELRGMVRSGTVAYELLRPVDLHVLWYSRALASRAAPSLLRAVPMFLVAGLFFGLRPPPSWEAGVAWVVVLAGALLLAAAVEVLMAVSLLWTVSGEGISRLIPTVAYLLCGIVLPLPLLPDWLRPVVDFLPFRGLLDVPLRVYCGHIGTQELAAAVAHQAAWIAALLVCGRWLLARAQGRLVVQGG